MEGGRANLYAWVDTFLMTLKGPSIRWLSFTEGRFILMFSVFTQTKVPTGQSGVGSRFTLANF